MSAARRDSPVHLEPPGERLPPSDYLQENRAAGVSPRTVKHYQAVLERVLLPFCAELGISGPSELTSRHLNQLSAGRAISKATPHSYVRAINSFLAWARGEGEDARAQLPSVSKRVVDTLSREEIKWMEDAASTERDRLIVRLLADTGPGIEVPFFGFGRSGRPRLIYGSADRRHKMG